MGDEPYVLRLNVRHYEATLKLLGEAHAQLAVTEAGASQDVGGAPE